MTVVEIAASVSKCNTHAMKPESLTYTAFISLCPRGRIFLLVLPKNNSSKRHMKSVRSQVTLNRARFRPTNAQKRYQLGQIGLTPPLALGKTAFLFTVIDYRFDDRLLTSSSHLQYLRCLERSTPKICVGRADHDSCNTELSLSLIGRTFTVSQMAVPQQRTGSLAHRKAVSIGISWLSPRTIRHRALCIIQRFQNKIERLASRPSRHDIPFRLSFVTDDADRQGLAETLDVLRHTQLSTLLPPPLSVADT